MGLLLERSAGASVNFLEGQSQLQTVATGLVGHLAQDGFVYLESPTDPFGRIFKAHLQ